MFPDLGGGGGITVGAGVHDTGALGIALGLRPLHAGDLLVAEFRGEVVGGFAVAGP